jgi:hypothetical protein
MLYVEFFIYYQKVYSRLSAYENESYEYEITEPCSIKFITKDGESSELELFSKTGYANVK